MNLSSKGLGSINQVLAETEMRSGTWLHQSAICSPGFGNITPSVKQIEVICPVPRRASRIPPMLDGLNGYTCNQRSLDTFYGGGSDVINILSCKDEMEGEPNTWADYFRGTPPERTGNPLIFDAEFIRQNLSPASPIGVGNTLLGLASSSFDWDSHPSSRGPSLLSSFSPEIRIEGFHLSEKKSESGPIVSARA